MTIRVKLCGVTRLSDALRAVDLGVDAIGFNFVPSSPRYIAPEQARDIAAALPPFVTRVGVFADERHEVIMATAALAGLHCVQLHGDERPEACASLTLPWYKAHRVTPGFRVEDVAPFASSTFLLDGSAPGSLGGSGRTFDWRLARRASVYGRVILAGGLTPDNVSEAVTVANPYAIDVNSGVETEPGRKDATLLARFMRSAARAADTAGDFE